MASNYPTSIDTFTNPSAGASLSSPSHSTQHGDANDAIEALEAKLGIGSSAASAASEGAVLKANGSGTTTYAKNGLWFVKSQTVGSAVSSVTVTDAFSSSFTNYRVVVSNVDCSIADNVLSLTLGSSSANYYSASRYFNYAGGTIEVNRSNAATAYTLGSDTNNNTNFSFDIFQPFLAEYTTWSGSGWTYAYVTVFGGVHNSATSYSSFTIATTSGTMTGGTIKVYGYQN
jgi:hypothetical protein